MLHGFKRLRPAKTQEELDAEKVLADFEAGKHGATKEEPPVKPPTQPAKPVLDEDAEIEAEKDPVIKEELKRQKRLRGFKKLSPGS